MWPRYAHTSAYINEKCGQAGTYALVRLKQPQTGNPFVFPARRFSVPDAKSAIIEAAAHLKAEVVDKIATMTIYVRGGADARDIDGQEYPSNLQNKIKDIHELVTPSSYKPELIDRQPRRPLNNADLPMLRADYVRSILRDALGRQRIAILDKRPSTDATNTARTVEIVLFVKK